MDEELREKLKDAQAKAISASEQRIAEFRSRYKELHAGDQRELREWLVKLVGLDAPPAVCRMRLLVETDNTLCDDDGEPMDESVVRLTPRTMLRAIEKWEEGDYFTPGFLGGS